MAVDLMKIATSFFQASLVNILMYRPEEYGKGLIKPFKIHPDTFVQMAIQLTYYKLHGKYVRVASEVTDYLLNIMLCGKYSHQSRERFF